MSSDTRAIREPAVPEISRRLEWRVARVIHVRDETSRARTLTLDVPDWPGHRAGQHVDVRLVAEDGYQAQRSFSIATPPEDESIALTVERLEDGEVSPYLTDVLMPGDGLEIRGPIGGHFQWQVHDGGPVLLVGGGSGVVPLMAMLRHHAHADPTTRARVRMRMLYSTRSWDDVIYRAELEQLARQPGIEVVLTLTREQSAEWTGYRRRIDREMLASVAWDATDQPRCFVCGPTGHVESVASLLVSLGHAPQRVKTERFGPTG